jgi:hypothetical protein
VQLVLVVSSFIAGHCGPFLVTAAGSACTPKLALLQ